MRPLPGASHQQWEVAPLRLWLSKAHLPRTNMKPGGVRGARPMVERGLIEIAMGEVLIRVRDGVAPRTIAAVLQAVKAQRDA